MSSLGAKDSRGREDGAATGESNAREKVKVTEGTSPADKVTRRMETDLEVWGQ